MADDLKPRLQVPGEGVVGPHSPVQHGLRWLSHFFADDPLPNVGNEQSRSAATGLGVHLLHLLRGLGTLNLNGFHSAAASLLRPLEDALDCFAAVVLVSGSAEAWSDGRLRASEAARAWTPLINDMVARGMSLADYRRRLREQFNELAHCSPELCAWNLYFNPERRDSETGMVSGSLKVNITPDVIARNAHALDAHSTAHLLELLHIVCRGYSNYIEARPFDYRTIVGLVAEVSNIMEAHDRHGCQTVHPPPEVRQLKL